MKLLIKQNPNLFKTSFTITDEAGNVRYTVNGETFSLGHKLHIFDTCGNEVGFIREKTWSWNATFFIDIMGKNVGMIKKEFTWIKPKYNIDFLDWYVEGDWSGYNYNVYSKGKTVANISQKLWAWNDTYMLDIISPEDELYALMLVLSIDAVKASQTACVTAANM